jgi:hypothetical protein
MSKVDLRKIRDSFSDLVTALVIQCEEDVETYNEAIAIFEDSWFENEDTINFAKKIESALISSLLTEEKKLTILSEYFSVMKNLVSILKRFVQWDNWFTLKGRKIWYSDKIRLNHIRRNIESGNFDIATKRIRDLLEIKLKKFILNYTRIFFGEKKWRRGLPEDKNKILNEFEAYIPLPFKEKSDILSNLHLEDFYDIIHFLTVDRMENKVEILNELNSKLIIIRSYLQRSSHEYNPWNDDVLEVVEICNNFLLNVLRGIIPCPWNSPIFISDKIKVISDKDLHSLEEILPEDILIDKNLNVKSSILKHFRIIDFIFTISNGQLSFEIDPDYKNEEIRIKKNPL